MGTATAFLALALARMNHSVELLVAWRPERELDPYWQQVYAEAGIRVRRAPTEVERVEPAHFAVPRAVELALRADPPEVLVASDLSAPAYSVLRLRQAGLAFPDTLVVVFCHGTRRWIMEMSARLGVKDVRTVLAQSVLEQAAVELADVVVSPSAYLVGWMREQGWQLPEHTMVIPYFTRSGALGEQLPTAHEANGPVSRLAFFGRLEDKKGLRPFLAAVNGLDPGLLRRIELEFVGKPTATWNPERLRNALLGRTRDALRGVSFATDLDQHEALERLGRPGTLTVIPSLGDNSPNTVYECLEHGLPFIASDVGGIPELIAPEDRARVLFRPTEEGVRRALERALGDDSGPPPARPAFHPERSFAAWTQALEARPHVPTVGDLSHEHVLLLDDDDVADDELESTLLRAQAATGADVVTCAVRIEETVQFFSGEPHGLGALSNDYGTIGLVRRELLESGATARRWPLFAKFAATGRRIVSVPLPLATTTARPGTIEDDPADALLVLEHFEQGAPQNTGQLARLAAGLAATARPTSAQPPRMHRRVARALRRVLAASRSYVRA
jgi:glycosyltransferase involved in cell wall biosynthesis